jgi:hypothetical protein
LTGVPSRWAAAFPSAAACAAPGPDGEAVAGAEPAAELVLLELAAPEGAPELLLLDELLPHAPTASTTSIAVTILIKVCT